jgi:ABC-type multidrug transport system ATPase subunit
MSPIIEVTGLSKSFGEIKAVDDLSFSVKEGEIYGFLGQNGAGKSTTIRMLLTLIQPSSGTINISGKNLLQHPKAVLRETGAIIEKPDFYKYLTGLENISMMAKLSGVKRTKKELLRQLERVGLLDRAGSRVKTFSQGMRQRLGIACALVHDPQLVILDEPTNGLDPQGIADVRNLILSLSKEEGKTVVVSSHLLSEIEVLADSMLIIDRGKKVVEGKVQELLNPEDTVVEIETVDDERAKAFLGSTQWAGSMQREDRALLLKMHRAEVPQLTSALVTAGIGIYTIRSKHSLEDYFLSLTTANQHVDPYKA